MLNTAFTIVIGILVALAAVNILVIIHELGHFFTAKFFKVKVEEFGIGFPIPGRIWGKKIGETDYTVNWLPAGGFVRLFGEDSDVNDPRSFSGRPAWQRTIIIVAGVSVNLIFAFILFTFIIGFSGWKSELPLVFVDNQFPFGKQESQIATTYVAVDSAASVAGLTPADKILFVDGKKIGTAEELRAAVAVSEGLPITLEVENSLTEEKRSLVASPRYNEEIKRYQLGIDFVEVAIISYESLPEKILVGPLHSANMVQYQFVVLRSLVTKSIAEGDAAPVRDNVSGVVGIVGVFIALIQSFGFGALVPLLTVMALLSLLLGIINVLPIPAVDGGRLFFVLIELFTRKKVNADVERLIHAVGFGVLIIIFVLVTFNDVLKFFG